MCFFWKYQQRQKFNPHTVDYYCCVNENLTLTLAKTQIERMALFQQSVLKKHLNDLHKEQLQHAWSRFTIHFHDPLKQQNICNAKEEQYQEGFLRELFVDVLGYTLNPSPGFNLTTEYKNEKDSKKADGAILKAETVTAVIELKGTDTTDLGKVETQAFSYKNNQKGCTYVITSNFEKLRFYINDAVDHAEFNLFTLTEKEFAVLYCCLQADALLNDTALKMKQASVTVEENVTKQLYADYSGFKRKLFQSIAILNTQYDQLTLFKKTQKLLDRFLFILFAEDRLLVPPNSVREILKDWEHLNEMDNYVPLYDRFKKYFGYLNNGYEGKKYEIFAYNGGLFAADEILDNIKVEDALLFDATKQLSQYDFETEVDVNILGHIFEHSLTEIEEVERKLTGAVISPVPTSSGTKEISPEASDAAETSTAKKTSKRKKDGVFYTPRYITKYIVENTVGALCNAKKEELEITDDAFTPQKRKDNTKKLQTKLETYRQWLLQLTICDPACGSGAFLNQALEFLITEHRYVDTLTAKLFGDTLVLSDVENSILENNLFGVDINEEAVEIARLSLWLRTARKGRKLNNLNNNIKVGNSLIDDPAVVGDKAFNWENQFAAIFENGGFDVVIGNPPWGAYLDTSSSKYLIEKYPLVPTKLKDTYMFFMLQSLDILKKDCVLGLIVPNTWLLINNTADFRKYLLSFNLSQIIDHGDNVFQDAIVESATIILTNSIKKNGNVLSAKYRGDNEVVNHLVEKKVWLEDELNRIVLEIQGDSYSLINKLNRVSESFDLKSEIIFGIKPYQVGHGIPPQSKEMVDKRIYHSSQKIDHTWKPLVTGTDVNRYSLNFTGTEFIKYGKWLMYPSNETKIKGPKLLLRRTSHDLRVVYDEREYYPQNSLFIITSKLSLKYLLCLFNSKLFDFVYKSKCPQVGKVFAEVKPSIIKSLPIAKAEVAKVLVFESLGNTMLEKVLEVNNLRLQFVQFLMSKIEGLVPSKKLLFWDSLLFKDFLKELEKQKIKLSLAEQSEWMSYFEAEKAKANQLQQLIDVTDKEIDRMVYALYELTEEEIKIVEG